MNTPLSICAYCGEIPLEITRDHVVPRALWGGKGLPANTVVVPACRPCQDTWDLQASYFRNTLLAMIDKGAHPIANRVLEEKVVSDLNRNPNSLEAFFRIAQMRPRMSSGGLFLDLGLTFEIDMERFSRIPEKIVRGLFYYKSQIPLSKDYMVTVYAGNTFWENQDFKTLLATMEISAHMGDDVDNVFSVRCARDADNPNCTAWLLVFFKTMGFFAWTEKIEDAKEAKSPPTLD